MISKFGTVTVLSLLKTHTHQDNLSYPIYILNKENLAINYFDVIKDTQCLIYVVNDLSALKESLFLSELGLSNKNIIGFSCYHMISSQLLIDAAIVYRASQENVGNKIIVDDVLSNKLYDINSLMYTKLFFSCIRRPAVQLRIGIKSSVKGIYYNDARWSIYSRNFIL